MLRVIGSGHLDLTPELTLESDSDSIDRLTELTHRQLHAEILAQVDLFSDRPGEPAWRREPVMLVDLLDRADQRIDRRANIWTTADDARLEDGNRVGEFLERRIAQA